MKKLTFAALCLIFSLPFAQAGAQELDAVTNEALSMAPSVAPWIKSMEDLYREYAKRPDRVLSRNEIFALSLFTGPFHQGLNTDLAKAANSRRHTPQYPTFARLMTSALHKLPSVQGTVYHVRDMSPGTRDSWKPGTPVSEPYFLSTAAAKIDRLGNTVWVIQSHSGRSIARYSKIPSEKEVLFFPGAQFTVTKAPYLDSTQNRWVIEMVEN